MRARRFFINPDLAPYSEAEAATLSGLLMDEDDEVDSKPESLEQDKENLRETDPALADLDYGIMVSHHTPEEIREMMHEAKNQEDAPADEGAEQVITPSHDGVSLQNYMLPVIMEHGDAFTEIPHDGNFLEFYYDVPDAPTYALDVNEDPRVLVWLAEEPDKITDEELALSNGLGKVYKHGLAPGRMFVYGETYRPSEKGNSDEKLDGYMLEMYEVSEYPISAERDDIDE